MNPDKLREKDLAVLQAIQNGANTTSEIREATTLTNREINYSLTEKGLEQHGLVEIHRVEGRQETPEGKTIWKPKQVQITDQGLQTLQHHDQESKYDDLTREELIQRIHELEQRQDRLETMFKDFRSKVMDRL
jgi:hypothetical protein